LPEGGENHLDVRLGGEDRAQGLQFFAKLQEIIDLAVVGHDIAPAGADALLDRSQNLRSASKRAVLGAHDLARFDGVGWFDLFAVKPDMTSPAGLGSQ